MRSPTAALLWEIWRRNRMVVAVIVAATVAGRLLDYAEQPTDDPSSLIALLSMVSFLFLFGVFSYTEPSGTRGIGSFPRRLFTLPVSSLRLVALPVLAGIAWVELLYLLWLTPLSRGGALSAPFVAVLLGAFMVFFQAVFWMLARLGPLRLMIAGAVAVAVYGVGLLPSWPPSPPPSWRSEAAVGAVVAALAVVVFLLAWRHILRLRCGGGGPSAYRLEPLIVSAAGLLPRHRPPFASLAAAQFWFEWRCSGLVLPLLVGGVLVLVIAPFSWLARGDASGSLQLLLGALATPIMLAIPVGMAFARPTFWSEDLSVPAFVAIRPITDEQIVAIKMKVAAASVAISWILVVCFAGVWLSLWANVDAVSQLAIQWWAFHEHSPLSVYGTVALILIAGVVLTWRFLVSRLWSGLSGSRPLFMASVMSAVLVVIAGMVFAADRLPGWVLDDPARMAGVVWLMSIAVVAKCWLAAYSWRRVSAHHLRQYLLVWGAATTCLLTLTMLLWGVVRIYVALDIYRFQGFMILVALLAVPLGRVGLAPSCLARNRHR
jgi:hypothetical protein